MSFPRRSFVTNTTLTHTNTPRRNYSISVFGNDHIVCHGGSPQSAQVTWHNSSGQLQVCHSGGPAPCQACGPVCQGNGGVGVDPPLNGHTDIHMYTDSPSYMNQDLECRVSDGQSAFIGVYLVNGGECGTGRFAKLFFCFLYLQECILMKVGQLFGVPLHQAHGNDTYIR